MTATQLYSPSSLPVIECIRALRLGTLGFLADMRLHGFSRNAQRAAADEIAGDKAEERFGNDKVLTDLWKAESRIYARNGVPEDFKNQLPARARKQVEALLEKADTRMDEIKAEELHRLNMGSLAAILLTDRQIYEDLIAAGIKDIQGARC